MEEKKTRKKEKEKRGCNVEEGKDERKREKARTKKNK